MNTINPAPERTIGPNRESTKQRIDRLRRSGLPLHAIAGLLRMTLDGVLATMAEPRPTRDLRRESGISSGAL